MKWGPLKDIPADLIEKSRDAMKFEDNKYQAFFQKAMKKFGHKSVGEMSPAEKKAFFNKIDKKYSAKDEGMETMVPNKKDDPKDMKRKQTMTGEKATKVEMEPKVEYDK